ncbi:gfo/Idh/MocA family oxidoreductase [candidate division KSB3 bacterium]|uniref:Gfo/Idh/MocA family oxidoreductase n=1 Tax=candidate division KSB3 bacterium TaxID=2044937 RepID=A0A9D5JUI7_9BACT|nr:gfo/Idh/MocA family oxidoreductase [candidate division KSB3 bacterium]MBD3324504.1 gfo/Idh/MocA family oxidoreductase [candidate division KSB3 bacterium]
MKKQHIRTGIVGAGFSAAFHVESLKKVYGTDVDVVGVFSVTPEHRERFAQQRGMQAFTSLDQLLDACDVVHVCTPASTHVDIAIAALKRDKFAVVEKPLTGFFGDGSEEFRGDQFPKEQARQEVYEKIARLMEAEKASKATILYAENWVYAPSIQKEREILEKTGAQILWMHGEESHSGSHSPFYGYWKYSGGGVMIGKGCHPLTAALYLKRVEGRAQGTGPIKPASVSGRIHALTQMENFRNEGQHIRQDYFDIEDFSMMHIQFEDGTIADIFASDIVLGGTHNWLEVAANNHRSICNINPNTAMQTYNPAEEYFRDIYVVEKIGTKQGWSFPSPDEDWFTGYPEEMEAFYRTAAYGDPLESDISLAADAISTIYSAYVSADQHGAETPITTF